MTAGETTTIRRVIILGATGDVGRGVVDRAVARGWPVTAVGRRAEVLRVLAAEYPDGAVDVAVADVSTVAGARDLADVVITEDSIAVVNAVSLPWMPVPILDTKYAAAATYWEAYLGTHLAVLQEVVPRLAGNSVLLAVGGGMADFVVPGLAVVSMSQAAQRMLYRALDAELGHRGPAVRELMVISKVSGRSNRDEAQPGWLTDADIGERICEIIAAPDADENVGPILKITPPR